ncbi:hypothetical protein LPJ63_003093 [Coemansia sp. RSA 2711]|nr:hypothetical protein LPJ63_003093 [Coemansia sp. RSA 2711]KAJ2314537.1 hypothetical protein IWW54_000868 [Coemansia sp. RSA 2705]KAJ2318709.1 hypothetical protein IWW52_002401 [Coemansia sp. RSA 2704]KAJ2730562.1 hypothetical protein H4R23_003287 [Coemansia sp. Cherry 401B]
MNTKAITVQLCAVAMLQSVAGQGAFDDFISNVGEAVRPAQNAAESFFGGIGNNIASIADQVGNNAASMATNAINDANNYQSGQIAAELSSYHSEATAVQPGKWMAATVCVAAAIHLGRYM